MLKFQVVRCRGKTFVYRQPSLDKRIYLLWGSLLYIQVAQLSANVLTETPTFNFSSHAFIFPLPGLLWGGHAHGTFLPVRSYSSTIYLHILD